jgi:hypothetical protein
VDTPPPPALFPAFEQRNPARRIALFNAVDLQSIGDCVNPPSWLATVGTVSGKKHIACNPLQERE